MNPNRVLVVAIVLLLFTSVATRADKVDDYIASEMKNRCIPGLALAVVKNGEVIKTKGYGLANLELNVSVTTDSVFELASVTKPFTATAIMMLVEEGKVGLDDKNQHASHQRALHLARHHCAASAHPYGGFHE